MAQRNTIAKKTVDVDAKAVSFEFPSLDQATYPPLVASLDALKASLVMASLHGFSQKIGDSYAGEQDPSEAYNKAKEMIERLAQGDWKVVRAKGEPSVAITVQAIARLRGKEVDEILAVWEGLTDERKKDIRADAQVKAEVAKIKAERAAAKAEGAEPSAEALAGF